MIAKIPQKDKKFLPNILLIFKEILMRLPWKVGNHRRNRCEEKLERVKRQ